MKLEEKSKIYQLKKEGYGYKKIASELGISVSSVQSFLKRNPVDIDLLGTCKRCGMTIQSIKGKKRNASIAMARQVAMFITRDMTTLSLEDVGREFGGKDHTTVLHSIKKVETAMQMDPKLDRDISELKENIRKSF